MFQPLGTAAKDLATVVVLFLPGFIAVSLFEASNPQLTRIRPSLQWALWSLAVSLVLYAAVFGIYSSFNWPLNALDARLYLPLMVLAAVLGYGCGRLAGTEVGRRLARFFRVFVPPWVWVDVMLSRHHIIVHLQDGTRISGYPRRFTDDPTQDVREVYLEYPYILIETEESGPGEWRAFPQTEGVLIASPQIKFIQVLEEANSD